MAGLEVSKKAPQTIPLGNKGPLKSEQYGKFFESMQADRKTVSQLRGADVTEAMKGIDDAIDFSTKMLLASAKNMGLPGGDGDSSKTREISEAANAIAAMMGTKANIQSQLAQIEAQKNPAVDLMSLKGKVVDYKDDVKSFFGEPVKYSYKVEHSEQSPSAVVNLTFTIRDKDGKSVFVSRQSGKIGEHEFVWNGKDDNGDLVLPGQYKLEIKAQGNKSEAGKSLTFPVKASATLSGTVESIKIENGTATGVMINGKLVKRDMISDVRDVEKPKEEADYLNAELIGKRVKLDFSRGQVIDGELDVYFVNHVEKAEKIKIKIFDQDNKFIKTLEPSDKVGVGTGKVHFSAREHGLEDGNYNFKTYVVDNSDPTNPVDVELAYDKTVVVAGINKQDKLLMSTEEQMYSPYNIESVVGKYLTPLAERRQEYLGERVLYGNDTFKYEPNKPVNFTVSKPQEDGVLAYGQMSVYEGDDLVAIVKGKYDLFNMLDQQSQGTLNGYMQANFGTVYANIVDQNELNQLNTYIEDELKVNRLTLKPEFVEDYGNGLVKLTFNWNGKKTQEPNIGVDVDRNVQLRRDFTPIYARPDNSTYGGVTGIHRESAIVQSVDEEGGKLSLNLDNGSSISEDLVLDRL